TISTRSTSLPWCKGLAAATSSVQGEGPRGRPRQRLRRRRRVERGPTPVTKVALGSGVTILLLGSVLRLGAGRSRAEYSGAGRDCGPGAPGVVRRGLARPHRGPPT